MTVVLFVVSMTALPSCSKDNADLILGKWKMTQIMGTEHGVTYSISVHEFMESYGLNEYEDFIIEFKNDGNVYVENVASPYSIDRDRLTIYEGEISVEMKIYKLTTSKLVLGRKEDDAEMQIEFQRL